MFAKTNRERQESPKRPAGPAPSARAPSGPGVLYQQWIFGAPLPPLENTGTPSPPPARPGDARDHAAGALTGLAAGATDAENAAPPLVHEVLRSPGRPLDASARSPLESQLRHDFHDVRIHTGGDAAASARAVGAEAYTVGSDVVFGAGQYQPGTRAGRELLAHELTHVVQQSKAGPAAPQARLHVGPARDEAEREAERVARHVTRSLPAGDLLHMVPPPAAADHVIRSPVGRLTTQRMLQRYTVHAITTCRAGDTLPIRIRPTYKDPEDATWSGRFLISEGGFVTFDNGKKKFLVRIGGMELVDAAANIADEFYDQGIFTDPSVSVTSVDGYAAAGAGSRKAGLNSQLQKYRDYIKDVAGEPDAVRRFQKWVEDHHSEGELGATTPAEVWAAALKAPLGADPRDAKGADFVAFMGDQLRRNQEMKDADERSRSVEALLRFQDWYDRNKEARGFLKRDPAKVYADLWVQVLKEEIDKKVRRDLAIAKQKALDEAEPDEARKKAWDAFYALALDLWGFSARTYPYRIPLPSEGKDILVWGQPGVQQVLNKAANDLMSWATDHMFETGFTRVNPRSVLAEIMKAGKYGDEMKDAQKNALDHETLDRNEIVPEKALVAFGETVAAGLLVIAVVAVFVGAEVITAGQATWILVAVAGAGGVKGFLDRRDEIENKGYDVPIPETIVHSAGDVIGVSQLVEGISGTRLGTDQRLGSDARSQQFGVGTGSVATFLLGSRAFKQGETFGARFKPVKPMQLPSGPNANVADVNIPDVARPATPKPSTKPGVLEATARGGLPADMQVGFDKWMQEIRARGADPEKVLTGKPARELERVSRSFARKYANEVSRAEESQYLKERSKDNPLRPELKNVKKVGDQVWIHYETQAPGPNEISHAIKISDRTGQPVHLFGDTASKISYPGIDGTIGNPPRPLSLKTQSPNAAVGSARYSAQQALMKARTQGYSNVEVEIDMPGKTVSEVKAGWDVKGQGQTAQELGPVYDADTIARVFVQCSDGMFVVPRPKTPSRTGVPPNLGEPGEGDKDKK